MAMFSLCNDFRQIILNEVNRLMMIPRIVSFIFLFQYEHHKKTYYKSMVRILRLHHLLGARITFDEVPSNQPRRALVVRPYRPEGLECGC